METLQFRYSECWMWPGSGKLNQSLSRALRRVNWRFLLSAAVLILYVAAMVYIAGEGSYARSFEEAFRYVLVLIVVIAVTLYGRRRGMAERWDRFSYGKPEQFRTGSMILKEESVRLMLEEKTTEISYRDITGLDCRRLERGWRRGERFHSFLAVWNETEELPGKEFSSGTVFEGYQMRIYYGAGNELFVTSREIFGSGGAYYDSLYLACAALKKKMSGETVCSGDLCEK